MSVGILRLWAAYIPVRIDFIVWEEYVQSRSGTGCMSVGEYQWRNLRACFELYLDWDGIVGGSLSSGGAAFPPEGCVHE
jgi:hypothetical protein